MLRLPPEAPDAALAGATIDDDGRTTADAVARCLRVGECQHVVVESASTNPAPNKGIGTRRVMTLASAGIIGWQCVSWNREQVKRAIRRTCPDVRTSHPGDAGRRGPPRPDSRRRPPGRCDRTAQLVPLKAGPSPSAAVSTSRKSSRPETELFELDRRDAGQGIAGLNGAKLRRQQRGRHPDATRLQEGSRAGSSARPGWWPPPR